jgi:SAM-dependent methyltransferase
LLDVGCGICDYSIRLARQGFEVTAVDLADDVLEAARANIARQGVERHFVVRKEILTKLSLPDHAFDSILCWGVLMHIPDVDAATAELARVLKYGGRLAVSEANMHSLESLTLRGVRLATGRGAERVERTPAGLEHWTRASAGSLVSRECDMRWLVQRLRALGLTLRKRVAGQFSESHVRVGSRAAKRFIHGVNGLWFTHIGWAGPALGNILIFERTHMP